MEKTSPVEKQARILLVEDDEQIRRLLSAILMRDDGFFVDSAFDGQEAIDKLNVSHYDVIVLDLMMPRVDGFDVLRHLARGISDVTRDRVIVLTAAPSKELSKLDGTSVFRVLRKPFAIADTADAVRACVAHHRGQTDSKDKS